MYLPLQIGESLFEHGPVTGIMAPLKLLNDALEGKAKSFCFAKPIGLFPRQRRVFGRGSGGCLVLLRLDGLAFPPPGHR